MKCLNCGNLNVTGQACGDCGSTELEPLAENNEPSTTVKEDQPAVLPAADALPAMAASMPLPVNPTISPVIATIIMPNRQKIGLRDGGEVTVASERCGADVTLKIDDAVDNAVSSTPFRLFARDGKIYATGGGANGYWIIIEDVERLSKNHVKRHTDELKYEQDVETEVPLNAGIRIGKVTYFKVK